MKKLLIFFFAFFITINIQSQTIISGGIFTNTTWTAVNSPYIVIDTLVVFPGVTLTIEPGVTVKFDNGIGLEVRQAYLIANGTSSDSITFTSNSGSIPGSWPGVKADTNSIINYCNFSYAKFGLQNSHYVKNSSFRYNETGADDCIVDSSMFQNNIKGADGSSLSHCKLSFNQFGVFGYIDFANYCVMDSNGTAAELYAGDILNCIVRYNQNGIHIDIQGSIINTLVDANYLSGIKVSLEVDSIVNCTITNNGGPGIESYAGSDGIKITKCLIAYNDIGAVINSAYDSLFCNEICSNNLYDLKYIGHQNYILPGNYWCTTDSNTLAGNIFDGYDDVNYGLVSYYPVDTNGCNLNLTLETHYLNQKENELSIYPNPSKENIQLRINNNEHQNYQLSVLDMKGQKLFNTIFNGSVYTLKKEDFKSGFYLLMMTNEKTRTHIQMKIVFM
jgi:hypothetical protein